MKRGLVMMILLLLFGGAMANIAVAWGIAYRADSRDKKVQFADEVVAYSSLYPTDVPRPNLRVVQTGFGVQHEMLFSDDADEDDEKWLAARALIARIGWPFAAWRTFYFHQESEVGVIRETSFFERGIDVDDWRAPEPFPSPYVRTYWPPRFLPLRPILPGFVINTLFYAMILWLLFLGPFTARRMIRRRRGQCATCAYPIGSNSVCTECGGSIPSPRNAGARFTHPPAPSLEGGGDLGNRP